MIFFLVFYIYYFQTEFSDPSIPAVLNIRYLK
jgi:hypothetical protein